MIEIKPPINIRTCHTVFLAGSIEMGAAENWQREIADALSDENVILFNPRRDNWDPSWDQSPSNSVFAEQVNWELDNLEAADIIFMYLSPGTKSPISLLELGLFARSSKLIVVCPDGFWRKGNVDIVCERHHIPVDSTIQEGIVRLKGKLKALDPPF